jgi:hypothetical protein
MFTVIVSCKSQESSEKQSDPQKEKLDSTYAQKKEAHRYGGWYCPDNFGFVPVDINKLGEVPAVSNRLPTEQELKDNMSLINVDTEKYPDAKALEMDLPRLASIYSEYKGMSELVIVIQAIIVQGDTVVGYRFANGGNGSAWLTDVNFLTDDEITSKGSQPFYYSRSVLKANTSDIWKAIVKTDYFELLGEKFNKKEFFSSEYDPESQAHLRLETSGERATGYVGMVFGNYYLHIDYDRDGFHYSEKLLIMESPEDNTAELFFVSGPFPNDYEKQKLSWGRWIDAVKELSESD